MPSDRRRVSRQVRLRRTIVISTTILVVTAVGIYHFVQGPAPVRHPTATPNPTTTPSVPAAKPHPAPSTTSSVPQLPTLRVGIHVPLWTTLATLRGPVPSYSGPAAVGSVRTLAPVWGAPLTLPIVARRRHWFQVRVIGHPNGHPEWVPAADVSLTRTPYYLMIDLNRKHLLLFREGRLRLYAPVGVGTPQAPTPAGRYFVAFFTESPGPGYGPFVIVTSALASTVTDWEEAGTPVITLNGPLNSAAQIASGGAAVSQGSVRLLNDDLQQLRSLPVGTPIDVVPTVTRLHPPKSVSGEMADTGQRSAAARR